MNSNNKKAAAAQDFSQSLIELKGGIYVCMYR
jgi:hypothetical protein